jgi:hypothetical protein
MNRDLAKYIPGVCTKEALEGLRALRTLGSRSPYRQSCPPEAPNDTRSPQPQVKRILDLEQEVAILRESMDQYNRKMRRWDVLFYIALGLTSGILTLWVQALVSTLP